MCMKASICICISAFVYGERWGVGEGGGIVLSLLERP